METLLVIVCFAAGFLLILGVHFMIEDLRSQKQRSRRLAEAKRRYEISMPRMSTESGKGIDAMLQSRQMQHAQASDDASWWQRWELWIGQSGLTLSPLTLFVLSISLGIVPAGSLWLATRYPLLTLCGYVLPALVPVTIIAILRRQRLDKLLSQLPDALDLMSRMLRAGQTIPQSLRGVADEFAAPLAEEFGYCYEQQNLGLSTDASMYEMARRTGVLEIRILVVALTVHRQSGGNLSELLGNLAAVIRDRYRIQGQIRSLTADGRLQAAILLALPPLLLVVLSVLNSDYVTILYQFPWLLGGMFFFEAVGALWLHRIVSFDF